jgi:alpha-tubulin suppressor-like RCC1 family protein
MSRTRSLVLILIALGLPLAVLSPPAGAVSGGTTWTVGENAQGQLGSGTRTNRLAFAQANGPTNVSQVDGGRDHGIVLDGAAAVWTWGNGQDGALGSGSTRDRLAPAKVAGLSNVIQVTTGHHYSMALSSNGTLKAWGSNELGQLGDGSVTNRLSPVTVMASASTPLSGVVEAAGARDFSIARKSNGTVWTWGGGASGELGNGTTPTSRTTPGRVTGLTSVVAIAGGRNHALALRSDGTVWSWGNNTSGQLGDGTLTNRSTAVRVNGLSNITAISAGAEHSVAVNSAGQVYTWGQGRYGQLGSGSTAARRTPALVSGVTGVRKVDCGRDHTLLVTGSGDLWAFGRNDFGQVGNGQTATARTTPYRVTAFTDVVHASGGRGYTVVLRAPSA